jgi:hypothetical protein
MNESQFESSLRALRPAAPPAAIEERIAAGLSQPEPLPAKKEREPVSIRFEQAREPWLVRCFHNLGWAIAGATSALVAIALFPAKPAPEKRETPVVQLAARFEKTSEKPGDRPSEKPSLSENRDPSDERNQNPGSLADAESSSAPALTIPVADALPAGSGETGDFQPLETTRELISSEEEGQVIYRNGSTPMRQVRNRYREHHSWTNPRTGARVEIEVPREDVFLKPVSLQ